MRLAVAIALCVSLPVAPASAQQTLTWDPNGAAAGTGGSATWNTTDAAWTSDGTTFGRWNNANLDSAVFGGTAGTVTIGTPVTVNALQFTTAGYSVAGGTLRLAGAGASITTMPSSAVTIASALTGSNAIAISGGGTTILNANSLYNGTITVAEGTLQVGNGGTVGSILGNIVNNGTLVFNRSSNVTIPAAISGSGAVVKRGGGILDLRGSSTYTGPTVIEGGTVSIAQDANLGAATSGVVLNGGRLQFTLFAGSFLNRAVTLEAGGGAFLLGGTLDFRGTITGSGAFTKLPTGTLILSGNNTYTGTTTIGGTLQVGNGGTTGTLGSGAVMNNGTLRFDRSDALTVGNTISGTGTIVKAGTGVTTLSGTAAASASSVTAGTLLVTGTLTSPVTVATGATLGGTGTIAATAAVNSGGTLAPGASAGTLTLNGLTLNSGSTLAYELGTPNVAGGTNDLVIVNGNVAVNGITTLDVADTGSFATMPGAYRLVNYSGSLLGGGVIQTRTIPGFDGVGEAIVQTAVAGQINLITAVEGVAVQFWDGANMTANGAVDGGTGTWNNATSNWTSDAGTLNPGWANGFAVFNGAAGTVTLGQNVDAAALQFSTDGYVVNGAGHTLTLTGLTGGASLVRVDPTVTTTIAAPLAGAIGLRKADAGTLVLTGSNTYTGGTTVEGGTLQIGNGGTSGSILGDVVSNGTLSINRSDNVTLTASISGTGTFTQLGTGTTTLTGTNSYSGVTTIAGGTLQVGNGGTTGTLGSGAVANGGTLAFVRSDAITVVNAIGGTGGVTQAGSGATTLAGANTYSGVTAIAAGSLQIGDGGSAGTLGTGSVVNNGTLAFNRIDIVTVANAIAGTGNITQAGSGTTILSGSAAAGATSITAGTLLVTGTLTSPTVAAAAGATLGGTGTISGVTTIAAGATLAPGAGGPGTLTTGSILLDAGSFLAFDLGMPNGIGGAINDLLTIDGDVTIVGTTLNVSDAGSFATLPGVYRLIGYTGTLTGGSNLALGTMPGHAPGTVVLQTSVTNQINLIATQDGSLVTFWDGGGTPDDGAIAGGSGTWNRSLANWTGANGAVSQGWEPAFAVFSGAAGTVTLGENVRAQGLQFVTGGYVVEGSGYAIELLALPSSTAALVRVEASATATINAPLTGAAGLTKADAGTLILTGTNTYGGSTTITGGTLQLGDGGTTGSIVGNVANDGTLAFSRADTVTFAGDIGGSGALIQAGAGTTVLTGTNTYTGATTIAAGTLQIGDGGTTGSLGTGAVANSGTLAFNRSDAITVRNAIAGAGTLVQAGTGTTTLAGTVDAGAVDVIGGGLFVNAALAAPTVTVAAGARLGGSGTIDGSVTIASGATLSAGAAPGTAGALTTGTLALASGALLAFDLGAPNTIGGPLNDIVHVNGSLTLGGTLNVTDAGAFAGTPGSYRLMTYTGALTGSAADVALGSTPGYSPSDLFVQTSVARSVNLIVTRADLPISFWDGSGPSDNLTIEGGAGSWGNGGEGWTNVTGSINQSWIPGMAIFDGAGGTVTLTADVQARALQFASDGYSIVGASPLTLLGMPDGTASIVRVDANVTATIDAPLTGASGLLKLDSGTLVLNGANTYTGVTTIGAGTLQVNGSVAGSTVVESGAILGGYGTILGNVMVHGGGTIAPGASAGTVTVGSLTLLSGSILNYELDTPGIVGGVNDLIVVNGDLTLAGTINVTALPGFGLGTYRLINYGGALTHDGVAFGALPADFGYQLVTNLPGQVSLQVVHASSSSILYWDGSQTVGNGVVDGGSGIWSEGITNWTVPGGEVNQAWGGQTAVFGGSAGVVTVVGDVEFTGLEFLTSGYTLAAGDGAALHTSAPVTEVRLDQGVMATIGVPIVGSGGLSIEGPGTLVLTADNRYEGGTAIGVGSTLQLGNGGRAGSIIGNVLNDGALIFNRSDVVEFPGTISGSGTVHQGGTGTLVLTGTNTYSGGTVIHTGTISISADANLGAASGALVFTGGTLQVTADASSSRVTLLAGSRGTIDTLDQSTTFSLSGTIAGSGELAKTGNGTLVLSGANEYTGGTFIRGGTLSVSADANLGAPTGSVTIAGGTLRTTATMAGERSMVLEGGGTIETTNRSLFLNHGTITGGALTKSGDGLLLLTGTNTYAGGTTIADGVLQLGNCGTTGSIVGDLRNDGALVFSRQDTYAFGGAISGAGLVMKECSGTTILTGRNTYTGGTLIAAGTLQGDTRSLQGAIVDNGSLVFDESGEGTFQGTLVGIGSMTKIGDGTVRLTGNQGLQGLITVQAGTLELEGTLAGTVHVANGARFLVNGAVGGNVAVDGVVTIRARADGNFGQLAVLGDLALRPGADLRVAIDAAGDGSTLTTGGTAIFAGGNIAIDPLGGGFNRVTHYALLGMGAGFAGTPTASSSSAALEPYLTMSDDTLFVTLLNTDVPLQPFAASANGWSIGGTFDRVRRDAVGDLLQITRQLTALDDAQLARALDAVSGEIHASATQMAALDGESVTDVVRSEISTRGAVRPIEGPSSEQSLWGSSRRRAWVRLRGERANFDAGSPAGGDIGRAAAHGAHSSLGGFALGIDWSVSTHWLAGAGGSYGTGSMRLDGLGERTDYAAPRALGYLGYARGRWGVHGGLSVAHTGYETTRAFQFAAIAPTGRPLFGVVDRTATSSPSGPATEVWLDGRFVARLGSWDAQPMGGIRSAWFHVGEWSEAGADALSLTGPGHTTRSLQADAGLRFSRAVGRVRPFFQSTYRRELSEGGTSASVKLTDLPAAGFEVEGLELTPDRVIGQGGLTFLMNRLGLSVLYELQHSRAHSRQSLQLGVGF